MEPEKEPFQEDRNLERQPLQGAVLVFRSVRAYNYPEVDKISGI